jgi:hypothetical protein
VAMRCRRLVREGGRTCLGALGEGGRVGSDCSEQGGGGARNPKPTPQLIAKFFLRRVR